MTDNSKNLKIRLDGEINVSVTPQGLPAEIQPVAPTPVAESARPVDPVVAPANAAPAEDTEHTQPVPEPLAPSTAARAVEAAQQTNVVVETPTPTAEVGETVVNGDTLMDAGYVDDDVTEEVGGEDPEDEPAQPEQGGFFTTTRQATSAVDEYQVVSISIHTDGRRTTIADVRQQAKNLLGLNEGVFRPYINGRIAQDNRTPNPGDSVVWLEDSKNRAA